MSQRENQGQLGRKRARKTRTRTETPPPAQKARRSRNPRFFRISQRRPIFASGKEGRRTPFPTDAFSGGFPGRGPKRPSWFAVGQE